jgi:EAL domain-containing protein (putative c-di-GMP-specific phosphodiesterase class I)
MPSAGLRPTGTVATTQDRRRRRAEDLASITGAAAIIVGGAALLGWRFGAGTFEALVPGLVMLYGVLAIVIWMSARNARVTEQSRRAALEELDRFFDDSSTFWRPPPPADTSSGSPCVTTALGYDVAELRSRPIIDFVHPADVEATNRELHRQVRAGQTVVNFQNRFRHRDGSYRWLEWSSSPSADRAWVYAVVRTSPTGSGRGGTRAPALALARRQADERTRIQTIIDTNAFKPMYQPIIDLRPASRSGSRRSPDLPTGRPRRRLSPQRSNAALGRALERAALVAALLEADRLPGGTWLSINVSPGYLADAEALRTDLGARARPLVLEITEHETISAYGPLRDAVLALGLDVRLAVDDTGAGVANFNHLVELRPNIVKVDAGLVRGVDHDVSRQAVGWSRPFATTADCRSSPRDRDRG